MVQSPYWVPGSQPPSPAYTWLYPLPGLSESTPVPFASSIQPNSLSICWLYVTRPVTLSSGSLASSSDDCAISSAGSPRGSSMPLTRLWNTVPGVGTTCEGDTHVTDMPYW